MISILSDFGLEDTYVAAMKAVIHAIAPSERILDLTHAIHPGDVARGALELWRIAPALPADTVILAVVDPGVGTDRKAIAFQNSNFTCVGPDNGLFTFLLDQQALESAVELTNPDYRSGFSSTTFHGRDIFAPAAAHIANGVALHELGDAVEQPVRLPSPRLEVDRPNSIRGEILYADRFGNLVTSIGVLAYQGSMFSLKPWVEGVDPLEVAEPDPAVALPDSTLLRLTNTFRDVPDGSLTAYIGSSGLLEIALNGGNASEHTGLQRGQTIELKLQG